MSDVFYPVAVVTGAGGGIGAAIARGLAADHRLVLVDKNPAGLTDLLARDLPRERSEALVADITAAGEAARTVDAALTRFERLDVLVNVVGGGLPGKTVDELTDEDWSAVLTLNLTSMFHMCRAVIPVFRGQGGGAIVNIGSAAGLSGMSRNPAYCAAKAAVTGLTRALAIDHGREGIRVNCIAPGAIRTPLMEALRSEQEIHVLGSTNTLGFVAAPDDVAAVVRFLAGPGARFVNGQTLRVDGGAIRVV